MKTYFPVYFTILCLWPFCLGFKGMVSGNNTLKGQIILPSENSKFRVVQGKNYKASNTLSAKKKEIDRLNHSDRHVIVSLHPLSFSVETLPATKGVVITQQEKTFIPKVVALTPGSSVAFLNEDIEMHNVQCLTPRSKFSKGRRSPGVTVRQTINKVGRLKVTCDIHKEMLAYVLCLDTPYFTKADANGNFTISGLPDGKYLLKTFHFDMGERQEEVELGGGRVIEKDVRLYMTKP